MKRWIVLLLAVMLSLSAFWAAGCGAQEEGTLLSSFESYDELINMRWLNDFGSAKLTTDERYVTDGAYAVHLTVNGDYKTNRNPAMGLVLGTRYEKTDYSDVDKISVDVYNDNDFTANIYFQYLTKSKDTPMLSSENKAELPPKTMTKAVFEIDRDFLSQLLNIDQVLQVRLVFDRADSYMQPYRSFYVDNLRYHTTNDPIDESVAAQEKETGNEESQTAKDRVDESEGAEKADEKKAEEKTEEKGDDKLDRLITAIDKLVAALTPKENREPDSFDQKYGFKTKEPPMAGAKEYGEKEINALLGK